MEGVCSMERRTTSGQKQISRLKFIHPTTTIKQTQFVPAPPGELYDAYLNPKIHSTFTGAETVCERFVGGKFSAWNGYITGKNVKLENGRRIVQEWQTTEWPNGYAPSLLEITFQPKGKGTEVHMVQKNVPAGQAKYYEKGWMDFYWVPVKKYFKKVLK
jgi:activator of HSP90 ATPase